MTLRYNLHPLETILAERIAIIDGAMGTTIRTYGMTEADMRGERFQDSTKDLLNNGDLFSLTYGGGGHISIHVGHLDIHENDVERFLLQGCQRLEAVHGQFHLMAKLLKQAESQMLVDAVVFGQQNSQGPSGAGLPKRVPGY